MLDGLEHQPDDSKRYETPHQKGEKQSRAETKAEVVTVWRAPGRGHRSGVLA